MGFPVEQRYPYHNLSFSRRIALRMLKQRDHRGLEVRLINSHANSASIINSDGYLRSIRYFCCTQGLRQLVPRRRGEKSRQQGGIAERPF